MKKKNLWLQLNRDLSFEEVADKILNKQYLDILENPTREKTVFISLLKSMTIHGLFPFLINDSNEIVLKTAFPSRKYHKKYRRSNDD